MLPARLALPSLILAALVSRATPLPAQDTTRAPSVDERIRDLEQHVRVLERLRELAADSAGEAARTRPVVGIGPDGFTFRSADSRWRLRVGGYIQADGRFFANDDANVLVNNFLIRRARPIIEGTVYKYFDFRIMPDFGQGAATLYEAYIEARLDPALAIRAGKFKPPIGLERLQSATDIHFVERGFPTNLVPNRDVGLQIGGQLGGGVLSYQAGIFDGVTDLGFGDGDATDSKDLAGRIFLTPFTKTGTRPAVDLGFGIAGGTGTETGTLTAPAVSTLRSPGQATIFKYRSDGKVTGTVIEDGKRTRVEPQAYLYAGGIGLLAQYTVSRHSVRKDTVSLTIPHRAWQVSASVLLTGEHASFGAVVPKKLFGPRSGSWGALEIAARIQGTSVDEAAFPVFADSLVSAQRARGWGLGINWYLARYVKFMLDYEHTVFTHGAATGDRPAESFISTRFQTGF